MLRGLPDLAKRIIKNRDKSKITKHLILPSICFCQRENNFKFLKNLITSKLISELASSD